MIVVEGPDGAGKTTLIAELVLALGWPVAGRVVGKDTKPMVDIKAWVEDNVSHGFQRTIFDRHRLFSEPVYGPILRKEQHDGFTDLYWLHTKMRRFYNCNPIIIYCLPPIEVVAMNLMDDPDNVAVVEHIEQIYAAYLERSALDFVHYPRTIIYDYTTHNPTAIIERVKDWL